MSNIVGFIRSLLPSFNASDLETDLEMSISSISDTISIYSDLEQVSSNFEFNNKEVKKLVDTFYKELKSVSDIKLSRSQDLGNDSVKILSQIKTNAEWVLKEVSDSFNDVVMSQALTAYKANLVKAAPHLFYISRYSLDLVNWIYIKESEQAGFEAEKPALLVKKQEEFVLKGVKNYARLLAIYGSTEKEFTSLLKKLEDVTLPVDDLEEIVELKGAHKVDTTPSLPNGFIGSPVYSVRLVFAQWEADRYRSMKDKKKLLELRAMHLRMLKESGRSDINTEKEIQYLQKRISDYDYKISKIEADLE